jgi:hypothetical protein
MDKMRKIIKDNGLDLLVLLMVVISLVLSIIKIEWYIDIHWSLVFLPIWLPIITAFILFAYWEIKDVFCNSYKHDISKINKNLFDLDEDDKTQIG